jgi:phosphatidate cytidylyltransferase
MIASSGAPLTGWNGRNGLKVLRWRLLSSLVLVTLLVTAAWFDWYWGQPAQGSHPGILSLVLLSAFAGLAAVEFAALSLAGLGGTAGSRAVLVLATVGVVVVCCGVPLLPTLGAGPWHERLAGQELWLGLALGCVLTIGGELRYFGRETTIQAANAPPASLSASVTSDPSTQVSPWATRRIAATVLAMCYIGIPLGALGQLRHLGSNGFGLWALLSVLVIPKVSDAGAYFVGRTWGRHKLIPRLSPGKTVEGAVGALVFGVLGAFLMVYGVAPGLFGLNHPLTWLTTIGYGLWISVAGMLGDLTESMFKRDARIKDSGGWLPGLGGMLDVVDSVLAASLAAYVFWRIYPGVPLP